PAFVWRIALTAGPGVARLTLLPSAGERTLPRARLSSLAAVLRHYACPCCGDGARALSRSHLCAANGFGAGCAGRANALRPNWPGLSVLGPRLRAQFPGKLPATARCRTSGLVRPTSSRRLLRWPTAATLRQVAAMVSLGGGGRSFS